MEVVVKRLLVIKAFAETTSIIIENIGKAIACFERASNTANSRFDQYVPGDKATLSIGEKEVFELFKKKVVLNVLVPQGFWVIRHMR